jgi:hypothetical protein
MQFNLRRKIFKIKIKNGNIIKYCSKIPSTVLKYNNLFKFMTLENSLLVLMFIINKPVRYIDGLFKIFL